MILTLLINVINIINRKLHTVDASKSSTFFTGYLSDDRGTSKQWELLVCGCKHSRTPRVWETSKLSRIRRNHLSGRKKFPPKSPPKSTTHKCKNKIHKALFKNFVDIFMNFFFLVKWNSYTELRMRKCVSTLLDFPYLFGVSKKYLKLSFNGTSMRLRRYIDKV